MPRTPKPERFPAIRKALVFYKVAAYVTGVMLLLLVAEMIIKYGLHHQLYVGGNYGPIAFVPWDPTGRLDLATGVNVSTGVLIAHGWLYVVYLFADFTLWSLMRWPGRRFFLIALGGVVPFLSFIVEARMARQVKTLVDGAPERATAAEGARV